MIACKVCSKPFKKTTSNTHCGPGCAKVTSVKTKKDWKLRNVEKVRTSNSAYNNKKERRLRMKEYRAKPEAREKELESGRKWYQRNPEVAKNGHLKRKFGMTLEEYNVMLKAQKGVCAICFNPETKLHKSGKVNDLAVDHCHKTGDIRGLLCFVCNSNIGKWKDSIELLQNAIEYLKKHKEETK